VQQTSTREKPSCLVDLGSLCIGLGAKRHELSISFFGGRCVADHLRRTCDTEHASESVRVRAKYGTVNLQRARGIVLPGDPEDVQSRYIETEVEGILVGCLYLPNGNPAAGPNLMKWIGSRH
jgi:hypothetical protein